MSQNTVDHGLLTIRPRIERQHRLESLAPNDERVDCGHEVIVAVRFAAAGREEIELAIEPGDETVEAGADKDRCFHYRSFHRREGRLTTDGV